MRVTNGDTDRAKLRARAFELYPNSRRMRVQWMRAQLRLQHVTRPAWAALIPKTHEEFVAQISPWGLERQFAPRTRREAGFA